jgi:hypothetical protein
MAKKPPETQDRFRIVVDVDVMRMGPLLATLTRLGFDRVGHELITDVAAWNSNGPRTVHKTTAQEAIIAYTKDHPTFQTDEIVAHFKAEERTPNSCYGALKIMLDKKLLLKTRPGNYQRIDGLLPPPRVKQPAPEALSPPKQRGRKPRFNVPNKDILLEAIRGRKTPFTVKEMTKLFAKKKRAPASVSPLINALFKKDKVIKQLSPGTYQWAGEPESAANG